MNTKISRLRAEGAVAEMDRRWQAEYADRYNASRLWLPDPVEISGDHPEGVAVFLKLANGARFGDITIRRESGFYDQIAVDFEGEPIDDVDRMQIGDVGEDAVLLDTASGRVMIYCYSYFDYDWDTGILIECEDLPELIATVALGSRYPEIRGPKSEQASPWWEEDPWYRYLREIGMAD
ncbi:hypothetical protein [Glycomyces tenuis]|uniref:hypothetical protein n=1 Tax=Glycomyces tenuis TaxID=58116 RepID=UPI00055965ED|nr:hypothetical protein [Glycomyces tenuis]